MKHLTLNDKAKGIKTLKQLKRQIGEQGVKGLKARINFLITTFTYQLKEDLVAYNLFDVHNLGERDFDTCLEMFDGDEVVSGVMAAASQNPHLKESIKLSLSPEGYQYWQGIYNRSQQNTPAQIDLLAV